MNKTLKISISVLLLVVAKAILDIVLVSIFFTQVNGPEIIGILTLTTLAGVVILQIFNILQRLYAYVYSVLFVFLLFAAHVLIAFLFPQFLSGKYLQYSTPAFVIVGNFIIFLLFKGLSQRISNESYSISNKVINLSKYSALLVSAIFLLFFVLKQQMVDVVLYYKVAILLFVIGFMFFAELVLSIKNSNAILDNHQVIRVENKLKYLLKDRFFVILTITSCVLSFVFTLAFNLFIDNILNYYNNFNALVRIFGFFTVFVGGVGVFYELFLKQKMILNLGVKNAIRLHPIFLILFIIAIVVNTYTSVFTANSDWSFIYLVISVFLMGFGYFTFENISLPIIYKFYLPINVEKRTDYYIKSFVVGLLGGILLAVLLIHQIRYNALLNSLLPFFVVAMLFVLIYLLSKPLYKYYRYQLQEFLDIQSKKISISLGLFKELKSEVINGFKGMQFVRYLNLMNLMNPSGAREVIKKTVNSEDNLMQSVSLIKARELCMLECMSDLREQKSSKYFLSSPNRESISKSLQRFTEVTERTQHRNYVEQLSISKDVGERVFGAKLAYFAEGDKKDKILVRLLRDAHMPVVLNAIISSQHTKKIEIIKSITSKLDNSALGNAAYSILAGCGTIILPIIEESFHETGQTEKVQLRIIQLFGDIANEEATNYLLEKLTISNQTINATTLLALSKCSLTLSEDKAAMLKHELEEVCKILIWNMSLQCDMQSGGHSSVLREAMRTEIKNNYESIFNLLSLLYSSKSVKLIRNNLFSNDFEKITFAIELASVLLKDEVKLIVLPLLQPVSNQEKISNMQDLIPTESLSRRDVLYTILQRESKWMNQWTKACAMSELAVDDRKIDMPMLLANMINPDSMIAELAARAVFVRDKNLYVTNKTIFGTKYTSLFDRSILNSIEDSTKEKQPYPVMRYDIINYLHKVKEFSDISGEVLKRLTDYLFTIDVKAGEIVEEIEDIEVHNYFYILYSGEVTLYGGTNFIKTFEEGSLISSIDIITEDKVPFTLQSDLDSVLYRISSHGFVELLTLFEQLPESIVRKTDYTELTAFEDFIKQRRSAGKIKQLEEEVSTNYSL